MYCLLWRPRYICFTVSSYGRDWQVSFNRFDKIELSNLNRQVMYTESDIGKNSRSFKNIFKNNQAIINVSKKMYQKKT